VIVDDVDVIHQARDTVIIEVNRDYPHFDRILGEHRWSEFLRNPSRDEKDRATQVFYCTYHTGRMVQKNGKLLHSLFSGWKVGPVTFRGYRASNIALRYLLWLFDSGSLKFLAALPASLPFQLFV